LLLNQPISDNRDLFVGFLFFPPIPVSLNSTGINCRHQRLPAKAKREPVFVEKAGKLDAVIQSDLLDALSTRLTMPLAMFNAATRVPTAPCPVITVKGQRLHALAHFAAPLPVKVLRRPVDNVTAQSSALVCAMDMVL
jgi:toxin CcdB